MAESTEMRAVPAHGVGVLVEIVRTMRPKDWLKNAFVFAAIAFSQQHLWTRPIPLLVTFGAFICFCLAAGSIYLINDLVDIEKDRAHPRKRNRPLPSGRLKPGMAWVAAIICMTVAIGSGFWLDVAYVPSPGPVGWAGHNLDFGAILITYVLVQGVLYSYYLKNIVILDIFTIAAGFVLRAVAGATVLDINITPWLLICMGLLALFLGIAKRRAEIVLLQDGAGDHRRILQEYSLPLLDQMMSIVIAATLIAYTLFTTTAPTLPHEPFSLMLVTVPFVAYAIFRYLYLIYKHGGGGNPADLVLHDIPLAVAIGSWGLISLGILLFA